MAPTKPVDANACSEDLWPQLKYVPTALSWHVTHITEASVSLQHFLLQCLHLCALFLDQTGAQCFTRSAFSHAAVCLHQCPPQLDKDGAAWTYCCCLSVYVYNVLLIWYIRASGLTQNISSYITSLTSEHRCALYMNQEHGGGLLSVFFLGGHDNVIFRLRCGFFM